MPDFDTWFNEQGAEPEAPDCETCEGTGEIDERVGGHPHAGIVPCPDCNGSGYIEVTK